MSPQFKLNLEVRELTPTPSPGAGRAGVRQCGYSFDYDPPSGTVLDAGTNTLTLVFTPTNTDDYTTVTDTVDLVVSPAPLTVSAGNTNRLYGATNPAFSGTIGVLVNGDHISLDYICNATNISPVGNYPIVPSLVDPDDRQANYTITTVDGLLTVSPAPLTVTAANASRLVGATMSWSAASNQVYQIQS